MNASEMSGYKRGQRDERKRCLQAIPDTWLDPLLTGPDAVIGKGPTYDARDVECLCKAIKQRVSNPK